MFTQRIFVILLIAAFGAAFPEDSKQNKPGPISWDISYYSSCWYWTKGFNYPQKSWTVSKSSFEKHSPVVSVMITHETQKTCYRCNGMVIGKRVILVHNCGAGLKDIKTPPYHYVVYTGKNQEDQNGQLEALKVIDISLPGDDASGKLYQVIVLKENIMYSDEVSCLPLSNLMDHDLSNVTDVTLLGWCGTKEYGYTLHEMIAKRDCSSVDEKNDLPLSVAKNPEYTPYQTCIVIDDTIEGVNRDYSCLKSYGTILTYTKNEQKYYTILRDDRIVSQLPAIEEYPLTYYKLSYNFYTHLKKLLAEYELCDLTAYPFKNTGTTEAVPV